MTQAAAVRTVLRFRSRTRRRPWRRIAIFAAAVLVLAVAAVLAMAPTRAARVALQEELWRNDVPAEVVAFYEARNLRPLWLSRSLLSTRSELRPEALQLAALVEQSLPGEVPQATRSRVQAALAAARKGDLAEAAHAEVALSLALGEFVQSTQRTPAGVQLAFVDPDFHRPTTAAQALEAAAAAPSLANHLTAVGEVNPIYSSLKRAYLAHRRAHGAGPQDPLILANLQRARVLPPVTTSRFVLVNTAAQQLWLYEGGQPKQTMRVVIGNRQEETPMMAGLMRYLVFNPYWELPVDMVRESVAPKVLKAGPNFVRASNFEILSDWSDQATPVDPSIIDWSAVAAGTIDFPVRQLPGGDNMMGQVKFMLPNELGIYLHDTPNKGVFQASQRLLSAGCVRLERAQDLVRWLVGDKAPPQGRSQRVDLKEAVPVYITYLTAAPGPNGLVFYPDVYGKDPALLDALQGKRALPPERRPDPTQVARAGEAREAA